MADESYTRKEFFALFFNGDVPFTYKFLFVAGVGLYAISPIDFIPDAIGLIGITDDLGVLFLGVQWFTHAANKHLEKLHEERIEQMPPEQRRRVYAAQNEAETARKTALIAEKEAVAAQERAIEVTKREEALDPTPEGPVNTPRLQARKNTFLDEDQLDEVEKEVDQPRGKVGVAGNDTQAPPAPPAKPPADDDAPDYLRADWDSER